MLFLLGEREREDELELDDELERDDERELDDMELLELDRDTLRLR